MFCGAHSSFYCLPLFLSLLFPFVICLLFCKMFYIKINFILELLNIYVPCPAAFSVCVSPFHSKSICLSFCLSVLQSVRLLLFSPDNAPWLIPSNGQSPSSTFFPFLIFSLSLPLFFPAARLP